MSPRSTRPRAPAPPAALRETSPVERWEKTLAKFEKELRALGRELPGVAREVGEAQWGLSRLEAAVRSSGRSASPSAFDPGALVLSAVKLDREAQTLAVRFASGARHELPLRTLRLSSPAASARLDGLRHGIVLTLTSGARVELASDLVLHERDPGYRAAHPREPATPDFGARIRALRRASGRTARAVAAAAGMAPSNYARLEASKHQPRVETLIVVAKALGVPLEELVRRDRQA